MERVESGWSSRAVWALAWALASAGCVLPREGRDTDGGAPAPHDDGGGADPVGGRPDEPCMPSCNAAQCGNEDGCGGLCGCDDDRACVHGRCSCVPSCDGASCGGPDGCGGICGCSAPQHACLAGLCACAPACDGVSCGGPDGCGASCGCNGAQEQCLGGTCTCEPACSAGCGWDDGCGGLCDCPGQLVCVDGVCKAPGGEPS